MDSPVQSDDDLGDSVSAGVVCVPAQSDRDMVVPRPVRPRVVKDAPDGIKMTSQYVFRDTQNEVFALA